jgi:hypothetical protein
MAITDRRFFAFDAAQTDLPADGAYLGASYHVEYAAAAFISAGCEIMVTGPNWDNTQGFGGLTWWAGPLQDNALGTPSNPGTVNNDTIFTIAFAGGGVNSPTPVGPNANVTFWQTEAVSPGKLNPPTQFTRLAGIITSGNPLEHGNTEQAQIALFNQGYYTDAVFMANFS